MSSSSEGGRPNFCAVCGAKLTDGMTRCKACGSLISTMLVKDAKDQAESSAAQAAPPAASLGSTLQDRVAQTIRSSSSDATMIDPGVSTDATMIDPAIASGATMIDPGASTDATMIDPGASTDATMVDTNSSATATKIAPGGATNNTAGAQPSSAFSHAAGSGPNAGHTAYCIKCGAPLGPNDMFCRVCHASQTVRSVQNTPATRIAPPVQPITQPDPTPKKIDETPKRGGNGPLIAALLFMCAAVVAAVVVFVNLPTTGAGKDGNTSAQQTATKTEGTASNTKGQSVAGEPVTIAEEPSTYEYDYTDTQEPANESIEPAQDNAVTSQTAPATSTPTSQAHHYEIYVENISWTGAKEKCEQMGGHLVTITSQEEMDTVVGLAEKADLTFVWLGGRTDGDEGHWITGEPFSYTAWYPGEPSHYDADGIAETCIELWYVKSNGGWSWNDERDNPFESSYGTETMADDMGYVCEWE